MNEWIDVGSKDYSRKNIFEKETIYCRYYLKKQKKYPGNLTPTMVVYIPGSFCKKLNLNDKDRIKLQVHNLNKNYFKIYQANEYMDGPTYGLSIIKGTDKLHTQFKVNHPINFPLGKTLPVHSKIAEDNQIIFDVSQVLK
jgi:hypothetical protein